MKLYFKDTEIGEITDVFVETPSNVVITTFVVLVHTI